jgi:hypothetical protein
MIQSGCDVRARPRYVIRRTIGFFSLSGIRLTIYFLHDVFILGLDRTHPGIGLVHNPWSWSPGRWVDTFTGHLFFSRPSRRPHAQSSRSDDRHNEYP